MVEHGQSLIADDLKRYISQYNNIFRVVVVSGAMVVPGLCLISAVF